MVHPLWKLATLEAAVGSPHIGLRQSLHLGRGRGTDCWPGMALETSNKLREKIVQSQGIQSYALGIMYTYLKHVKTKMHLFLHYKYTLHTGSDRKLMEGYPIREMTFPSKSIWFCWTYSFKIHRGWWKCSNYCKAFSKDSKVAQRLAVEQLVMSWAKEAFLRRIYSRSLWVAKRNASVDVKISREEARYFSFLVIPLTKSAT